MRLKVSKNKSAKLLIVSVVLFFWAGCTFRAALVGHYDNIVDKSVHQIASKTTAHISKILDNKGIDEGSFNQNKQFYSDIKGEVHALIVRAEALEEGLLKTPLTDNFKELLKQYNDLETLHQMPFNENVISMAQEALDMSFRAIVKHLVYMKWNQETSTDN